MAIARPIQILQINVENKCYRLNFQLGERVNPSFSTTMHFYAFWTITNDLYTYKRKHNNHFPITPSFTLNSNDLSSFFSIAILLILNECPSRPS